MKIENKNISEIIPYVNNARSHDDKQIKQIAGSIKEFGFNNPILIDQNNVIIAGHGRYEASLKLKLDEVPCVVLSHLSDAQKKAYTLADNKIAENSTWNEDLLKLELENLKDLDFNIDLTGFDDLDLSGILEEEKEIIEDEAPEVDEENEPIAKLGQIYKLGNHRLMCGDSTSEDDVSKLMDGNLADMVFTDPPYNIDYKGLNDNRKIKNDKMDDDSFVDFLNKSIPNCETMYICCSWQYAHLFRKSIENKQKVKSMIIWNKINPAQHLDKYFKQHEVIFYCGKFGGEKTIRGDVWEIKRQRNTVHPTMKPIELIAIALNDNKNKINILDVFGGSGSTLIACEQLDRHCYMMELDPKYIDVIIKRWETLTGEKAEIIEGE